MTLHELAGWRVGGHSIGGIETFIDLPDLKIAFDVGRAPDAAISRPTLFFTHAHMDHMGGVAIHAATRALRGMTPPTYVVPRENAADFERLLAVWRRLDGSDLPCDVRPLGPGEEHELPGRLVARAFRSDHVAPCQGYALWSRRPKLRPELRDLPPAEIARLRAEGREVTRLVETPELAFCGDTRIEVVEREEVVRRARVLILECTFLDERVPVDLARAKGHVHLDEIAARASLFENEALLLTHFSARYRRDEIPPLVNAKLPPTLRERVQLLLNDHR